MRISETFPTKYLSAEDLRGKTHTLTIASVVIEIIDERTNESKPVVAFQGTKKMLVLNKTNANNIVVLYGDETAAWVGRQVEVYPTTTDFQGRTVPCLRVRGPIVAATAAMAAAGQPQAVPVATPQDALTTVAQPIAPSLPPAVVASAPAQPIPVAPAPDDGAGLDPNDPIPF